MIQFENIRSGEVVTFSATQDPLARMAQIAAYLNSSDMSPNALKGQDFGWRLAPEIKDEIDRIKGDLPTLDLISKRVGVPIDELRDFHILNYIVEQTFQQEAMAARQSGKSNADFEEDYQARVKALRAKREGAAQAEVTKALKPVDEAATTVAPTLVAPEPETPITETTDAETVDAEPDVTEDAGELDLPGVTDEPVVANDSGDLTVPQADGTTEAAKPAETTSAE